MATSITKKEFVDRLAGLTKLPRKTVIETLKKEGVGSFTDRPNDKISHRRLVGGSSTNIVGEALDAFDKSGVRYYRGGGKTRDELRRVIGRDLMRNNSSQNNSQKPSIKGNPKSGKDSKKPGREVETRDEIRRGIELNKAVDEAVGGGKNQSQNNTPVPIVDPQKYSIPPSPQYSTFQSEKPDPPAPNIG